MFEEMSKILKKISEETLEIIVSSIRKEILDNYLEKLKESLRNLRD